jgi:hypothetical protein
VLYERGCAQANTRLDALADNLERLSVQASTADGASAHKVTKQAVQAAIAEARADSTRCHQDLAARLTHLETLSTMPAIGSAEERALDRPTSPLFAKAGHGRGRAGLRQLVECCVEELEGRLAEQCCERSSKAEEAVKRCEFSQSIQGACFPHLIT